MSVQSRSAAPASIDEYIAGHPPEVQVVLQQIEKGNLRFPLEQPMPLDLIRRPTELRVGQDRAKATAKANSRYDRPASRAQKRQRA